VVRLWQLFYLTREKLTMSRPKLWLTYTWLDNESDDVDFLSQELERVGVEVCIDRWVLGAGKRLWEQIEEFITNPAQCDAWALYATQTSISREGCKEELAYALDRALKTRGGNFPLIGITPSLADVDFFPGAIRTRLCVSLEDVDWAERIKAAAEGRSPTIPRPEIAPYSIKLYRTESRFFIEMRPRVGTWTRFFVGVSVGEREDVDPTLTHGPSGSLPAGCMLHALPEKLSEDGQWWLLRATNLASPTMSYFLQCRTFPSRIFFGPEVGQKHIVEIEPLPPQRSA
jgi:TIR domain